MDFFLTRHPIFDPKKLFFGYELNFSKDLFKLQQQTLNADRGSSKIITESLFMVGLDKLVTEKKAFIPFSRNLLLNRFAELLPQDLVIIQLSREIGSDMKVIQVCRDLKSKGYLISTFRHRLILPSCVSSLSDRAFTDGSLPSSSSTSGPGSTT